MHSWDAGFGGELQASRGHIVTNGPTQQERERYVGIGCLCLCFEFEVRVGPISSGRFAANLLDVSILGALREARADWLEEGSAQEETVEARSFFRACTL